MLRNIIMIIFSLSTMVACSNSNSAMDYSDYYSNFSYDQNSATASWPDDYGSSSSKWEDEDNEDYLLLLEEESEYEEEMF